MMNNSRWRMAAATLLFACGPEVCAGPPAGLTSPHPTPPMFEVLPWEYGTAPIRLGTGRTMPIADFDNDGLPDIAYQRESLTKPGLDNSNILIRTLHGDFAIKTLSEIPAGGDLGVLFAADLDDDGRSDLLSSAFMFFNTEAGWVAEPFGVGQPDPVTTIFGQHRFNDDEYPDFLVRVGLNQRLAIGTSDGPTVFQPYSNPQPPAPITASVAVNWQRLFIDLDEDGLDDMLMNAELDDGSAIVFAAFCSGGSPVEFTDSVLLWQGSATPDLYAVGPDSAEAHGRVFVQSGVDMDEFVLPLARDEQPLPISRVARFPARRDVQWIVDVDQDGSPDLMSRETEEIGSQGSYTIVSQGGISYGFLDLPGAQTDRLGGVGSLGSHTALFDVNGDGFLDLLVSKGIAVNGFKTGAKPRFNETETTFDIPIESSALASDFDGDGDLDLIAHNVILQPESPTEDWVQVPSWVFQAINPYAIVRVMHPAYERPVVVHNGAREVQNSSLALIDLDDSNAPTEVGVMDDKPIYWGMIVAVDLDEDGADEIIGFGDDGSWHLVVREASGHTYAIAQSIDVAAPAAGLAVGDFNGDGKTDIAAAGDFTLDFYLNDGTGVLIASGQVPMPMESNWLESTDLNGDGRLDLVAGRGRRSGTADIVAWIQPESPDPTLGLVSTILEDDSFRAAEIYAADFNRNGVMDLFVVGNDTPPYVLTEPLDPARRAVWLVNAADASPSGALADINGDGFPDVVSAEASSSWPRKTTVRYSMGLPAGGCVADLNGDAIVDYGDIQAFVQHFLEQNPSADLNGDGIVDLGDVQAFVGLFLEGC